MTSYANQTGADEGPESAETLKSESISIGIDKAKIAGSDMSEEMKDWIMKLPETLTIDSPVTLIVGENGSGKTSFARGLMDRMVRTRAEQSGDSDPLVGSWEAKPGDPAYVYLQRLPHQR
jgi:polynucleotide 5'-kinase involved in rRNA processing